MTRLLLVLSLALLALPAAAGEAKVTGVRVWSAPDNTRLVFEISEPVEHSIFGLSKPDRLIVDLKNSGLSGKVDALSPTEQRLLKLRHGKQNQKDLRVVLDLQQRVALAALVNDRVERISRSALRVNTLKPGSV